MNVNNQYKFKFINELKKQYPSEEKVIQEITRLSAILNLPKGTEHFVSDIHGENEMFLHIMKTASGVIRRKIDEEFADTLSQNRRAELAMLIYYPEEKLNLLGAQDNEWYYQTILCLIKVCKIVSGKYTRSKVRLMLSENFSYIIDELLNCDSESINKELYYRNIIFNVIDLNCAPKLIIALCYLIQNCIIDHLHIVGDIYDRGKRPDIIMDYLMKIRSIDIQWGNHDILWIGASKGNLACILVVLSSCLKYGNLEILEEGYSINLLPLYNLIKEYYDNDPCTAYHTPFIDDLTAKMYKAVSIMRFKIEDSYKKTYSDFGLEDQTVLDKINFETGEFKGVKMKECIFPTIDPSNPTMLNDLEQETLDKLKHSFENSTKLKQHRRFLLNKGSLYLKYNGNLLFHGCIPLDDDGNFEEIELEGRKMKGQQYMDYCDERLRKACKFLKEEDLAFIWQLWCGWKSPLFGKDKLTTFEQIYIEDKKFHTETKLNYFNFHEDEKICRMILKDFGLDDDKGHIINGHVPVKYLSGESPIKAGGKMINIDGGMSKPFQNITGIAGYTLTYNSYGLAITHHEPFINKDIMIKNNIESAHSKMIVENTTNRIRVKDTDIGVALANRIKDLKELLAYYSNNY